MNLRRLMLSGILILAACSRTGSLYGDVFVQGQSGEVTRAARIPVSVVPSTEAFEREWDAAVLVFREELGVVLQAQKAAALSADEARKAWGQALAARGSRRRKRSLSARFQEQELRRQMRVADSYLFRVKTRVAEVVRMHDGFATALLDKYKLQLVQTDENGHYVMAGIPAGKAYVTARFRVGNREWTWFQVAQVRRGVQRVDLTGANAGGWPFTP